MSGVRRMSRELALQVLFQQEFSPQQSAEEALDNIRRNFQKPPAVFEYASELLKGIESKRGEIDQLIQKCSAHWKLQRMALIDLNIMRIAAFELKFSPEQLPPAVVINEAVEISKEYSTVDSAAFVNGILDQIVKQ